jgi:hypothetical protein
MILYKSCFFFSNKLFIFLNNFVLVQQQEIKTKEINININTYKTNYIDYNIFYLLLNIIKYIFFVNYTLNKVSFYIINYLFIITKTKAKLN